MKKLFLSVMFVLLSATISWANSYVTFTWNPNQEIDLKEYRLYQSAISGLYEFGEDYAIVSTRAVVYYNEE